MLCIVAALFIATIIAVVYFFDGIDRFHDDEEDDNDISNG